MNLLLENWRKYLSESNSRDDFKCPSPDRGYKVYYRIDRNNPPRIENILSCWAENAGHIYDSNVNEMKPAIYPTEELTEYREYGIEDRPPLRNPPGSKKYQELKEEIKAKGIGDPLIVFIGKNDKAKIGEGNHRHEIALELGISRVPVRFIFWKNVSMRGDYHNETPT